jgi:hypothetical protein
MQSLQQSTEQIGSFACGFQVLACYRSERSSTLDVGGRRVVMRLLAELHDGGSRATEAADKAGRLALGE